MQICREEKVQGKVTSLTLGNEGHDMFVGTASANIYYVPVATFAPELRNTCHYSSVSDVCFPRYNSCHYAFNHSRWGADSGYSELFATCGGSDIRVWNSRNCVELLRIQVPNVEVLSRGAPACWFHTVALQVHCVAFTMDGTQILSGWSDGKVIGLKLCLTCPFHYLCVSSSASDITANMSAS